MLNPFSTSLSQVRKITLLSGLVSVVAGLFLLLDGEPVHKTSFQGIALLSLYLLPLIFGFVALGQAQVITQRMVWRGALGVWVLFLVTDSVLAEIYGEAEAKKLISTWLSENAYWTVPVGLLAPGAILLLVGLGHKARVT
ncbi:hypothetical protein [uncultured Mameliella sp.]|uniref:hypothetical protein n=1 Tax=uncultured Mameliella sp. TaxID=1447087 RepID=UPI00262B4838|nr:hypothetical protein [uncultured Mameliella sp.]